MSINEQNMLRLYLFGGDNMAERQDRRIEKTRKIIRETLLNEMKELSYQELSVSKLCRDADIGRGTFYLHYNDIYEVVQEIEEKLLTDFRDITFRHFDIGSTFSDFLRELFQYVLEHRDEYQVFLFPHDSRFAIQFRTAAIDQFYYHAIKYQPKHDPASLRYKTVRNYEGIAGVIGFWFQSGFQESPDQLVKYLEE